jgi:hypothetical protein
VIPGIARTVRQLEEAGQGVRAEEAGHYLALVWMLSGIGAVTCLTCQWLSWSRDNYQWEAAFFRRRLSQRSLLFATELDTKLFILTAFCVVYPFVAIFIGGARHDGRFAYNYTGDQFSFFMGIWWNGGQGWLCWFFIVSLVKLLYLRDQWT